jgi:hypothetical protein
MQRMTQDMKRLRKDIAAGRQARRKLRAMLAEHHRRLQRNVADFLGGIRQANAEMFTHARGARQTFLHDLCRQVSEMRSAYRSDRAGARRAWHG